MTAASSIAGTDEIELHQGAPGSGSVKATLAQIRKAYGTVPTVVSVGSLFTSTGVPTATLPGTHALNDILLLIIVTGNETGIITTPTGYSVLGPRNGIGVAGQPSSVKLHIYWKRDNGSESAPTLTDSGDHTVGVMVAVRGCITTGDPYRMIGQNWKLIGSTTGTGDTGATRQGNSLVMTIFAHAIDSASAQSSGQANADLTGVTENFDGSSADGTGGGIAVISGTKVDPGSVGATTVTWGSSTVDLSTTISFPPADAFPTPRGPETMMYIGSAAASDDNYFFPAGARKCFVQLCDAGGGGSGGNTTTTAAGGGGGGGGGYDEAWYEIEDLGGAGGNVFVRAGKGGAGGATLNAAGNLGGNSAFDVSGQGPLTAAKRNAGVAATAAASADGGNGGTGAGRGTTATAVQTTRLDVFGTSATRPHYAQGGAGGSGTTAPVGGGSADWGGGGGESGADTDAATSSANNGYSLRGGGGGGGGRTNTTVATGGDGGGGATGATQGGTGSNSTRLPYGGGGGAGGGSTKATGGDGGFPGGGGGGGGGVAGGFGGQGGHGIVVVTTFF